MAPCVEFVAINQDTIYKKTTLFNLFRDQDIS